MQTIEIKHILVSALDGADNIKVISDCVTLCGVMKVPIVLNHVNEQIILIYPESTVESILKDYDL